MNTFFSNSQEILMEFLIHTEISTGKVVLSWLYRTCGHGLTRRLGEVRVHH